MNQNTIIHIAAAVIISPCNRILLVRKRHSAYFMQAGGKIEQHETPIQALIRELNEELGLLFNSTDFEYWGEFLAQAANEANHHVKAHLFATTLAEMTLMTQAELCEVGWYSITQTETLKLAPLTKNIILPLIEKNKPTV